MELKPFVDLHLELLSIEKDAEIEEHTAWLQSLSLQTLQHKGICLPKVKIGGHRTGMYGRCIVSFEAQIAAQELPSHSISSGDIAGIWASCSDGNRKTIASGIVTRVTATVIQVAFEEGFDALDFEEGHVYTLVKLTSDVSFRRTKRALERLSKSSIGPRAQLVSVLFGNSEPNCIENDLIITYFNSNLNNAQQQAVKVALYQKEVSIIHGPPGTGKTTTVVEAIRQFVHRKMKVLVCAPSNIAVDNILEKLSSTKLKLIRLGHPARVLPNIQKYVLDSTLHHSENSEVLNTLRDEIDKLTAKGKKSSSKQELYRYRTERQNLIKELKQREKVEVENVLRKADVVLATLTGASEDSPIKHLTPEHFDIVVIDECSQAIEGACWIPLLRAPKCLLAGDHVQLPPTIYSKKAAKRGLAVSLMERLVRMGKQEEKKNFVQLLNIQYRMHENIMKWPSSKLYDGRLIAHESVAKHLLKDLPGMKENEITITPLLFIDTAGCNMYELELEEEDSKGNEGEADLVNIHVEELIKSGLRCEDIAVIAPYNLQVDLVRLRLAQKYPGLEIKSVDGFQGREKEAVVLTLVRSNDRREIGFLAEDRRINVAITRAKRHLAIVGDSETVSHHPFLKELVEYMTNTGEVWSADLFVQELSKCESTRPPKLKLKTSAKTAAEKTKMVTLKNSGPVPKPLNPLLLQPVKNKVIVINCGSDSPPIPIMKQKLTDAERAMLDNMKREQFERDILAFKHDREKEIFKFPNRLTSFERMIIHELADKHNVFHISEGDGDDRHITLFKNQIVVSLNSLAEEPTKQQEPKPVTKPKKESKPSKPHTAKTLPAATKQCPHCLKQIPFNNFDLHIAHCDKRPPPPPVPKKEKKIKESNVVQKTEPAVDEIDSILNATIASQNVCHHKKCDESVKLFGQICPFCKEKYCLSHHMAEIHGCGDDARAHAKKSFAKEHISGRKVDKTVDPTKRIHLQRKLDKKLSELTNQRRVKK